MAEMSSRTLRQSNRASVLRFVVLRKETTRAELAAGCQVSVSTVTNVLGDLMSEGLVEESGLVPSDGGRPIRTIRVASNGACMIGIDVGEHGVRIELFDLDLRRVDRVFRALPWRRTTPARVAELIADGVAAIRSANPAHEKSLIGIGLGLPGIVETGPDGRDTLYAQSLGWKPVAVEELLGTSDVPIFADNGAKTLATAELWFGAAKDSQHSIVALVGSGIGAGVISGGRLLRGSFSSAGEWGHTKISIGGPSCHCGAAGCLEAHAGGTAILDRWRSAGEPDRAEEESLATLIEAADAGQAAAAGILDEAVEALGIGLANLVNLFNPEKIIIGGWAGLQLFEARADALSNAVRRLALARPASQCQLTRCQIGADAIALGAAVLPLELLIEGAISAPKVKS